MNWFLVITQVLILVAVLIMPYVIPIVRMGDVMLKMLVRLERHGIIEFKKKGDGHE